jgi:acetyl-CoA/propionyl-CoA carboxylase biotin carboxyl carrier protein
VTGHSIEFRINAEDPGRGFLPAPGTLTRWHPPSGPGIRLDGGYDQGETVPGAFDSLVAKLIVSGRDRTQALERSRRALKEFVVEGMPSAIPFHAAVVDDPAFIGTAAGGFSVHTRWIETEFDNLITPYDGPTESVEEGEREKVTVEVGGKRLEVVLPAGLGAAASARPGAKKKPARRSGSGGKGAAESGDSLTSPMQGTIVKIAVEEGATVAAGDLIVVLEAMKMEQPLNAHKAGTVTGLTAEVGATVAAGAVICELKD